MNNKNRDDLPTLRVTNLSEDCTDNDLWELFQRFGRINRCVPFAFASLASERRADRCSSISPPLPALFALTSRSHRLSHPTRIYVGKDQETGLCKGFAFVSFESRAEAEKAMGKINGLPYDHLILACSWSGELDSSSNTSAGRMAADLCLSPLISAEGNRRGQVEGLWTSGRRDVESYCNVRLGCLVFRQRSWRVERRERLARSCLQ